MIHFISVSIKNFRSYKNVTVNFEEDHGIYIFSGDNGSGKSTFLNAINWCLYGDTPFFSVGENKDVVNISAGDDDVAEVELWVDINDSRYQFLRKTRRGAQTAGSLAVHVSDGISGDWRALNGVDAQDAVMRFVPKDIRQLFFFNGEQLKDIYSGDGRLRANVYKVSELDVIDNAMVHLDEASRSYLRQIKKCNANSDKIDKLEGDIDQHKNGIAGCTQRLAELKSESDQVQAGIETLNKIISDTAEARRMLEDETKTKAKITESESKIKKLALDQQTSFIEHFHEALMFEEFRDYKKELDVAQEENLIPPPIDPKVTQTILDTGTCICGRKITDEEREFIKRQHEEYSRRSELQFLTDGIWEFSRIKSSLSKEIYDYVDLIDEIVSEKEEKNKNGQVLKRLQEQLEFIDRGKLQDNPEVRRTHLEKRMRDIAILQANAANIKNDHIDKLNSAERELSRLSRGDAEAAALESKRRYSEFLIEQLRIIKEDMELNIRKKLEKNIWESFSKILPGTVFTGVLITENYSIIMKSDKGKRYTIEMLSTGQAKVLGLSLVNALSTDLGYEEIPLLIDNLYGDIDADHYRDVSGMIDTLSDKKQAIIMNLMSLNVDNTFDPLKIAGEFTIIKNGEASVIKEVK